jgi:hypothetical protein
MVETNEFANRLPPFDAGRVFLAADGELWVQRGRHDRSPAIYDRFSDSGVRIGQAQLASNQALVGIGRRHVYVAATDEDGLQTLERYPRPGGSP